VIDANRKASVRIAVLSAVIGLTGVRLPAGDEAPRDRLVAHWNFDDGSGTTLRDVSGQGHDGSIHGATFVRSPWGAALRFDGVDDYVDCGRADSLNLSGDLTIEVRLRPTAVHGRNQLVFGDAASLTINRNYNLRIDRSQLRFEHGDGVNGISILADEVWRLNVWQHVAIVCEPPRYYVYRDGTLVVTGRMEQPITPTHGASRHIGGWFAGYFQGEIDDLRLYNSALPERVIRLHADKTPRQETGRWILESEWRYTAGQLVVDLFCTRLPSAQPLTADIQVLAPSGGRPLARKKNPLRQTRPGSERGWIRAVFSTDALRPGTYQVRAIVRRPDGRIERTLQTEVTCPKRPAWFGSHAGLTTTVPKPWTDVVLHETADGDEVKVWGRTYRFRDACPLARVVTGGVSLLRSPARIVAQVDNDLLAWEAAPTKIVRCEAQQVILQQEFRSGDLTLHQTATVEYDGFIGMDWSLRAKRDCVLQRLVLEIPLERDHARYLYCWPVTKSGALERDFACRFKPILWVGDERRGLSWLAESDRNWWSKPPMIPP